MSSKLDSMYHKMGLLWSLRSVVPMMAAGRCTGLAPGRNLKMDSPVPAHIGDLD
jgi:hypothetical protein